MKRVLIAVGVAVLYIACAKLGLFFAFRAEQVTAFWPPTGLAIAAVFCFGRPALLGAFIGAFVANYTTNEPLLVAMAIATGNSLEALAGATILRRIGFDAHLRRIRDVFILLVAVTAAPIVSATIGVVSLVLGGVQPAHALPSLWWIWWIGDALGGLTFAPPLLTWAVRDPLPQRRGAVLEAAAMLAALASACAIVFGLPAGIAGTTHVAYVFFIWAALRLGPAPSATAVMVASTIAAWGTHIGRGPFAGAGPERGMVLLQLFMGVATMTALTLAAVAAQNREAQSRAEVSERRLLMAIAAGGLRVWDWNLRTGELFYPRQDFAGTFDEYRKLIHPDDLERVEASIRYAVGTRAPYHAIFRMVAKDGTIYWNDARGHVVVGADDEPERMIGISIDITRSKELEEALRLEGRRKDEFLAMLGHELRNPLAPILNAVEILGERDTAAGIIRRQAVHLSKLVDDLLDVSRINSGKVKLEKRSVTLADLVSSAIDMWRHLIQQRRQHLTIDLPREPVWVSVDPGRMTQVIANLVHNAVKFTPEGGSITVGARQEDGQAVLRVRDSGVGMAPEVLEHAFELFVQGPPPLDRPQGGLGLGLTLVRRLVELHGGSVAAHSEGTGRGSEFVVRLAVAQPVAAQQRVSLVERPAAASTRRVLVVEDNDDARDVLVAMLRRDGHDVRAAADGEEGLVEAQKFTPEVVLLDIGLPGMDGYEVARRLRTMPETATATLIAVTGYGQDGDRERSRIAGIDHHLLKPVERKVLAELLWSAAAEPPLC